MKCILYELIWRQIQLQAFKLSEKKTIGSLTIVHIMINTDYYLGEATFLDWLLCGCTSTCWWKNKYFYGAMKINCAAITYVLLLIEMVMDTTWLVRFEKLNNLREGFIFEKAFNDTNRYVEIHSRICDEQKIWRKKRKHWIYVWKNWLNFCTKSQTHPCFDFNLNWENRLECRCI